MTSVSEATTFVNSGPVNVLLPSPPGYAWLRIVQPNWAPHLGRRRCDGETARGTHCRFRAAWLVTEKRNGRTTGIHHACKIHKDIDRWWS